MDAGLCLAPELPSAPIVTCGNLCRSADHLRRVVDQHDVEANPRYKPELGADGKAVKTWCNIFAWDVTRALGAELPHWLLGHELNANALWDWLAKDGHTYGWLAVDQETARAWANQGHPVVVVWRNMVQGRSGHIAVGLPDEPGIDGLCLAQAGAHNRRRCSVALAFGLLGPLKYYVHP